MSEVVMKKELKNNYKINRYSENDSSKNCKGKGLHLDCHCEEYGVIPLSCFSGEGKMRSFLAAFSLAEVLITLTIIGVIAALTIPNLMQKHQEQEFIQKLKKNYSVFSNAYTQAIRENGFPDEWDMGEKSTNQGAEKLYKYIKPYIKVQKECGYKGYGCFSENNYKPLFGSSSLWDKLGQKNYITTMYFFLLEDGTSAAIWTAGTGCSDVSAKKTFEKSCGSVILDLNNKKGPNRIGVDTFMLSFTEKFVVPTGTGSPKLYNEEDGNQCTYNTPHIRNGIICAVHAIYKGNMDYLRRDISSEW